MANKSKAKGTKYESDIVKSINAIRPDLCARRIVLHGNHDHGDIHVNMNGLLVCIEAKWRTDYPSIGEQEDYRRQCLEETANSGADVGVFMFNHFRQSIYRSEVWMTHETFLRLTGVDAPIESGWVCKTLSEFLQIGLANEDVSE